MSPVRMNEAEMALRAGMAYMDAFNRRDTDAMQALLAPDCRYAPCDIPSDTPIAGRDAVMDWFASLAEARPGALLRPENAFGYGKRSVIYWAFQFQSGVVLKGVCIVEATDGLIIALDSFSKTSPQQ